MYEKKKVTVILLAALVLVVGVILATLRPIMHYFGENVTLCFDSEQGTGTVPLSEEEGAQVRKILNGKVFTWDLYFAGPACGFDDSLAIKVGDTFYFVSQDDCGVVQKANSNYYYDLTNEEWDALWAIFVAHGANHQ